MSWRNNHYWPTCFGSQDEAGIEPGPLDYPDTDDHGRDWQDWFALGWGVGLLFGLALGELWETATWIN